VQESFASGSYASANVVARACGFRRNGRLVTPWTSGVVQRVIAGVRGVFRGLCGSKLP